MGNHSNAARSTASSSSQPLATVHSPVAGLSTTAASTETDPALATNARPRANLATFREPPIVIDSLAFALSNHLGAIRPPSSASPPNPSASDQDATPTDRMSQNHVPTSANLTELRNFFESRHMRPASGMSTGSNSSDNARPERRAIYFDPLRRDRLHGRNRRDSGQQQLQQLEGESPASDSPAAFEPALESADTASGSTAVSRSSPAASTDSPPTDPHDDASDFDIEPSIVLRRGPSGFVNLRRAMRASAFISRRNALIPTTTTSTSVTAAVNANRDLSNSVAAASALLSIPANPVRQRTDTSPARMPDEMSAILVQINSRSGSATSLTRRERHQMRMQLHDARQEFRRRIKELSGSVINASLRCVGAEGWLIREEWQHSYLWTSSRARRLAAAGIPNSTTESTSEPMIQTPQFASLVFHAASPQGRPVLLETVAFAARYTKTSAYLMTASSVVPVKSVSSFISNHVFILRAARAPNTPFVLADTRTASSSISTSSPPTFWTVTQLDLPPTCNPHGTLHIPINKLVGTLALVFLGTCHPVNAEAEAEESDNDGVERDEQRDLSGNAGQSSVTSGARGQGIESRAREVAPKVVNIESLAFLGQVGPFTFSDGQLL